MQLPQLFDRITTPLVACGMLSKVVRELRAAAGWTQVELAKKAAVSQQLITKIEQGKVKETRKLPKIAAAFGLSVEQLIGRMHGIGGVPRGADPQLALLLQYWQDLSPKAKEHVVEAAEFARSNTTRSFRSPGASLAVHESKATYSAGRRARRREG